MTPKEPKRYKQRFIFILLLEHHYQHSEIIGAFSSFVKAFAKVPAECSTSTRWKREKHNEGKEIYWHGSGESYLIRKQEVDL